LPCYNETENELRNTIESINNQVKVSQHSKILVVICDGKIPSGKAKYSMKTNEILTDIIFKDYITFTKVYEDAYKMWDSKWNDLEVHTGIMNGMKFIIFIKSYNLGKRDSLTLVRRMTHYYNTSKDLSNEYNIIEYYGYLSTEILDFTDTAFDVETIVYDDIEPEAIDTIDKLIKAVSIETPTLPPPVTYKENKININTKIDYIIGTDADTILDPYCAYELIYTIQNASSNTVGVVGFVDVVKSWNPLVIYQYCEYVYAQCLKRYAQSNITHKVSCLSGCDQLIKVCKETCGNAILDNFNRLPEKNESILNHIRSYASEDRNHICLMFAMYPYVETVQTIKAISYTHVPDTIMKFTRQRKRWCAGASSNDLLIVVNPNHNKWERLQSFVNVLIFVSNIFVFVATIQFIMSIILYPTYLILQLATIMLIPALYSLLIPIIIYNDGISSDSSNSRDNIRFRIMNKNTNNHTQNNTQNHIIKSKLYNIMYYYAGFLIYYIFGSLLNLSIYFYTFYYLDDLNWNRKRVGDGEVERDGNGAGTGNTGGGNGAGGSETSSNSSNHSIVGCEIAHTCNCLKWILTYGCSCKYARSDNDEYSEKSSICDGGSSDGGSSNGGSNGGSNDNNKKSKKKINIDELWDNSEI